MGYLSAASIVCLRAMTRFLRDMTRFMCDMNAYAVATVSRLLQIISLFCRI